MEVKYYSPIEVEAIYGIKVGTLAQWRWMKIGPEYSKIGRSIRYSADKLDRYFKRNRVRTFRKGEHVQTC